VFINIVAPWPIPPTADEPNAEPRGRHRDRGGVYGVSFGVLAVAAAEPAQAVLMSMLVFTGASQFAFVGVLAGGGGALAASGPRSCWPCATPPTSCRSRRSSRTAAPTGPGRALVIDESTAMGGRGPIRSGSTRLPGHRDQCLAVLERRDARRRGARRRARRSTLARTERCSRRRSWRSWRHSCAVRVRQRRGRGRPDRRRRVAVRAHRRCRDRRASPASCRAFSSREASKA
jgi:hypothetical protein